MMAGAAEHSHNIDQPMTVAFLNGLWRDMEKELRGEFGGSGPVLRPDVVRCFPGTTHPLPISSAP